MIIGTLIIHEAWTESDSFGSELTNSLHENGLEAKLSLSMPLTRMPTRQDYDSDPSLTDFLANVSVCTGFDYVKLNVNDSTISVAVSNCFNNDSK